MALRVPSPAVARLALCFAYLATTMDCGTSRSNPSPGDSRPPIGTPSTAATSSGGASATSSGTSIRGASSASSGAGCSPLPTSDGGAPLPDAGVVNASQTVSPNIVVDQFGYRTGDTKVAVIKNPKTGFDTANAFTPGATYALVDAHSGAKLLMAAPVAWNGGKTDTSSGDQAWVFDFSTVKTPGQYFVLDTTNAVRSPVFAIWDGVYRDVLVQSTRMYYYQRDGIAKPAPYAGAAWQDTLEHPQDAMCGLYSDGSARKNLMGGWFDAGDENSYTNWHALDGLELLHAFVENPAAFGDDTNIPESGNGVPDILDELKWMLDWMGRMQQSDGSVLSIKGHKGASPPSADTAPCRYGAASTSASFSAAAVFAYASHVFATAPGFECAYPGYAASLATQASQAYAWATANPNVTFHNTMPPSAPDGGAVPSLGGGEQELSASDLAVRQVIAAVYLFEASGDTSLQSFIDANTTKLLASFDSSHIDPLDAALEYALLPSATAATAQSIRSTYKSQTESSFLQPVTADSDPYGAPVPGYWWGDNFTKSAQGDVLAAFALHGLDSSMASPAMNAAENYVHYIHGVNPLQLVYLSAMGKHGAEKFVMRFFHTWFAHGSDWDQAGVSKYGPPPGYLTGGANPGYTWDACCPSGCGGSQNNAACGSAPPSPPSGQPDEKSYLDFNDGWPLDSWSVTEPDVGYQAVWVRLLSKFVR